MTKPHSFRFGIVTTPPLGQESYSNATERKVNIFYQWRNQWCSSPH